ncbi:MAG: HD domain-containing protein [Lachnospiraceae bacterium]|nr:HD domain-containing protein [Lachnospiraceae bacterium]
MKIHFTDTLFALSYALDCVEHDVLGVTTHHGKRVAALTLMLAQEEGLSLPDEDIQALAACAILHDCALTEYLEDEYQGTFIPSLETTPAHTEKHCEFGEKHIAHLPIQSPLLQGAVLYHHENTDGSGPFGKKGAEIPLSARLIHMADSIDANYDLSLLSKEKLQALSDHVTQNCNILFAEKEVNAFMSLQKKGKFKLLHTDRVDACLSNMIPSGTIECTPAQLIDFATIFAIITDYKSHFTRTHSIGIATKAKEMAVFYGADDETAARFYFAGALHDIGKLVVDRDILEKPDKLDAHEYRHIQTHAYHTYRILSAIPEFDDITAWASYHHEKLDGTGYPFGLKADKLDHFSRVLACLDIYQALTEERPYKSGMTHEKTIAILDEMVQNGKLDGSIVADLNTVFS